MRIDVRRLRMPDALLFCVSMFLMLLLMAVDGKAADPSANYPSRAISFVTHLGPGSNGDTLGRLISDIIQREKLLNQPLIVVNKPGTGGAVAYGYVFERKANPNIVLAITTASFLCTPLLEKLPYNYKSFTHIANLLVDASVLVVKSDSPFKTVDDIIAEARRRPKELIQGGGSFTSAENMMGRSLQMTKGVQWNFISFAGGDREAILNLLAGNVHFAFAEPLFVLDNVRAGKLRAILSTTPDRHPQFKDIPTIHELGLGEPLFTYRGIAGPPDMPDYAVKKLEEVFKKVMTTDRFKKHTAAVSMLPLWMSSKEYSKFLDKMNDRYKVILSELNLLKK
jgi:putative tricarboxylic transport membrane protein